MDYSRVSERVEGLCAALEGQERADAERVVAVSAAVSQRERVEGQLVPAPEDLELRRELGRLVELLSRRSANAIPVATLGRVLLADLAGDRNARAHALRECDEKLLLLGW